MNNSIIGLSELVKEAYIKPIRTLLAIDDEFPTLDELLDAEQAENARNKKGASSLREIVKFARDRDIPWLVDVHDGQDISGAQEKRIAPRLHSSDLMVLDYHLKGEELGGSTAIDILRGLAANDHFNLVVLYTKGQDGQVLGVMHEIATGLCCKSNAYDLSEEDQMIATDALERWQASREMIVDELLNEFTSQLFLKSAERREAPLKWLLDIEGNAKLKALLAEGARHFSAPQDLILRWLFVRRQEDLLAKLSNIDVGQIRTGADETCCWISCEKLFITLLSKQCAPKEFETKIVSAIVASHPSPHRLLLTKMRATIEQRGLVVENEILRDTLVQTAWLDDFLQPDQKDETAVIVGTISRHWDAIGDLLREELIDFGSNLRAKYHGVTLPEVMNQSGLPFVDPKSRDTLLRYNSYISTKPLDRGHLTTGHIFSLPQVMPEKEDESAINSSPAPPLAVQSSTKVEYWMCLSPACDMVPGQKNRANFSNLGAGPDEFLPFSAVRLHEISAEKAVGKATENLCVFIKLENSVQAFSILPNANLKNPPFWEQMIAKDQGIFNSDTKRLRLSRISTINKQIKVDDVEATVFAQLRSDYASNLLQKFGAQLTRPGLGMQFKSGS